MQQIRWMNAAELVFRDAFRSGDGIRGECDCQCLSWLLNPLQRLQWSRTNCVDLIGTSIKKHRTIGNKNHIFRSENERKNLEVKRFNYWYHTRFYCSILLGESDMSVIHCAHLSLMWTLWWKPQYSFKLNRVRSGCFESSTFRVLWIEYVQSTFNVKAKTFFCHWHSTI